MRSSGIMVVVRSLAMVAFLNLPSSAFMPLSTRVTFPKAARNPGIAPKIPIRALRTAVSSDPLTVGRGCVASARSCSWPSNWMSTKGLAARNQGRRIVSLAAKGAGQEQALQERLWKDFDVLPDSKESPVQLETTQDTGSCDLGLVARTNIDIGDVLVSVPIRFALSVNFISRKDELSSDFRLAIFFLQVLGKVPGEEQDDEELSERWKDYVETLLPSEANAAVLWDEEEIDEVQYEKSVEDIKALKGRLDDQCKRYLEEGGAASEEDLRWALGIVRSRSFRLVVGEEAKGGRQLRSLVPVADLFNHRPESPATWAKAESEATEDLPDDPWQVIEGDDGELYVDIVADKKFAAGEEVLLPYGLETGAELLISHGLALPGNEAEYLPLYMDMVELVGDVCENELQQDTATARAKLGVLQKLDAAEAPLAIRPGSYAASGHLLGCLQVAYADSSELEQFSEEFAEVIGHFVIAPSVGEGPGQMSAARAEELLVRARRKAAALCEEEVQRMPTTLAHDRTLLEGGLEARLRAAVQYRIAAKEMLQAFHDDNAAC